MKNLLLLAVVLVAAQALPFNLGNGTFHGGLLNATRDAIHKKMEQNHANIMKCFSPDQLTIFNTCQMARMSGEHRRNHGGPHRGGGCGNATESSTQTPDESSSTVNSTRRRRSPAGGTKQCYFSCILQKMGALDAQGSISVSVLNSWIDKANISSSQKTSAKATLETCLNSNFTLPNGTHSHGPPLPGLLGNGTRPFFGRNNTRPFFSGNWTRPFPGNRTRPLPKPDPACMQSVKTMLCIGQALLENGCSGNISGNKAALTLPSEIEFSEEDYDGLSSEEEQGQSAAMKRPPQDTSSSEESDSESSHSRNQQRGQRNNGGNHRNGHSGRGSNSQHSGKGKKEGEHQEGGHREGGRQEGGHREGGRQEGGHREEGKGNRNSGGHHGGNSSNEKGKKGSGGKGQGGNTHGKQPDQEDDTEDVTGASNDGDGSALGANAPFKNLEQSDSSEENGSSSGSNSESNEDGNADAENLEFNTSNAPVPGIYNGRSPSAGRPGVGLKG